ncbi:spore germination protein [Bacillus sp. NPDC094106]|uniref:spore germination protein n=1 Tax=Bacillus sp. NPDC094106 TaxID=3363949 RepID=UPI0037FDBB0A
MKVSDTMPAVIEGIIIENCNGMANLGDKYNVHPISAAKTYAGSGAGNTGFTVNAFNGISTADVNDNDGNDQGIQFSL